MSSVVFGFFFRLVVMAGLEARLEGEEDGDEEEGGRGAGPTNGAGVGTLLMVIGGGVRLW
jgi:hypothetical protein